MASVGSLPTCRDCLALEPATFAAICFFSSTRPQKRSAETTHRGGFALLTSTRARQQDLAHADPRLAVQLRHSSVSTAPPAALSALHRGVALCSRTGASLRRERRLPPFARRGDRGVNAVLAHGRSTTSAGLAEAASGVVLGGGLELPHAAAAMKAKAPTPRAAPLDRCDMRAAYRT